MDAIFNLFVHTLDQVITSLIHNWPFLIVSILISAGLTLYLDPQKVSAFLIRHRRAGVVGATVAAVGTPLCSCGTTAVLLGMMASYMPWAPIVAFMVASPLTSPEELVYSAGIFGWPFAISFFISSILLGLLAGLVATLLENRGWFKNQTRYAAKSAEVITSAPVRQAANSFALQASSPLQAAETCACSSLPVALSNVRPPSRRYALQPAGCCDVEASLTRAVALESQACSCGSASPVISPVLTVPSVPSGASACGCDGGTDRQVQAPARARVTPEVFLKEIFTTTKRLLPMFVGFAFIGYLLNNLIPSAWVSAIFGAGNAYSVPLAATLGLPLYINSEGSLPLVRALIEGGMSQGAALAFLITGAGTSVGAMMGALAIARWRVIGLVVGILWVGAVVLGFAYNLALAAGLW